MYSIRNIIDREEQPEKMYFIPDYNFLGKAAGQNVFHSEYYWPGRAARENVFHFPWAMRNLFTGVSYIEFTYSAVNKWIDGYTLKTIALYTKKHLPKLHLTHKSLK